MGEAGPGLPDTLPGRCGIRVELCSVASGTASLSCMSLSQENIISSPFDRYNHTTCF